MKLELKGMQTKVRGHGNECLCRACCIRYTQHAAPPSYTRPHSPRIPSLALLSQQHLVRSFRLGQRVRRVADVDVVILKRLWFWSSQYNFLRNERTHLNNNIVSSQKRSCVGRNGYNRKHRLEVTRHQGKNHH